MEEKPKSDVILTPLPANIKGYIALYDAIAEKDEESPFKEKAKKAIEEFEQRITAVSQNTPDRAFLEEYRVIAIEGSTRKFARKKKYEDEKKDVLKARQKALEELNFDRDYTGRGLKAVISRIIPLAVSYGGSKALKIVASMEGTLAVTALVWGATEIIINKVSKTQEEKIFAKYNIRLQEIEEWFSHDKGLIYKEAEDKADNAYKAYYGRPSDFPKDRPGPTEAPKLYAKKKVSIWKTIGLKK